jgi:hypothetical protein
MKQPFLVTSRLVWTRNRRCKTALGLTLAQEYEPEPKKKNKKIGFDHGVGHSLLLLYDAKAPRGQKSKEFKGLGYYPSNTLIRLFYIIPKYTICVTI